MFLFEDLSDDLIKIMSSFIIKGVESWSYVSWKNKIIGYKECSVKVAISQWSIVENT